MGCGSADLLELLKKNNNCDVVGVDLSPVAINNSNSDVRKFLHVDDARKFLEQKDDSSFDLILMIDFLEHIPVEDLEELLTGIYRVLRTDGTIISRQPNAGSLISRDAYYSDYTHKYFHSWRGLEYLFRCAGFKNLQSLAVYPQGSFRYFLARVILKIVFFIFSCIYKIENGLGSKCIMTKNFLIIGYK